MTTTTVRLSDTDRLIEEFSGQHLIRDNGDCPCGQDGVTCQVCGHRLCGDLAVWTKVPKSDPEREGNLCVFCSVPR